MAERPQYDARNELSHSGQESVFPEGVSTNDFLKIPYMTGALQFLSRKTSVSGLIIGRHLADVAYYVGRNEMREAVLDVVRTAVQENSAPGDDLVVLGHSLGSIVAYDVLDVVALIHPLAPEFQQRSERQIVDDRTNNPSGPHNIVDHLADPDVAAPISRAMKRLPLSGQFDPQDRCTSRRFPDPATS
jgi:hypothetical protein